jgi:hypothetical protein
MGTEEREASTTGGADPETDKIGLKGEDIAVLPGLRQPAAAGGEANVAKIGGIEASLPINDVDGNLKVSIDQSHAIRSWIGAERAARPGLQAIPSVGDGESGGGVIHKLIPAIGVGWTGQ